MGSIMDYFPYPNPRPVQEEALRIIEENYDQYDVMVLVAPTAAGKSAIARTIQTWTGTASYLAPTNLLVDQFEAEFPDTQMLRRVDSYKCHNGYSSCTTTRAKAGGFCKGCPAGRALVYAKYKRGPIAANYHMWVATRTERPVLVMDEAHNLVSIVADLAGLRLWKHKWNYPDPDGPLDRALLLCWFRKLKKSKQQSKVGQFLEQALTSPHPQFVIQRSTDWWTGGGLTDENGDIVKKGTPIEADCLELKPVDIRDLDPTKWFFPRHVEKVVLMSATIGRKDVEQLGLARSKVLYIQCSSPIPGGNRPIIYQPVVSVNRENFEDATRQIGGRILELAEQHPEKGLVHATYSQAGLLSKCLTGPRFLFHTKDNKKDVYKQFRDSDPTLGLVLVASGMYEGIDLPYDAGRWQVVAKTPWKSLGDEAIRHMAEKDPDWYAWQTWKDVIQACGRICRTETDFGVTFLLDGSMDKLFQNHFDLVPEWWKEALVMEHKWT